MNFWKRADLFPPCLCRLLARHRYGKPMTAKEIGYYGNLTSAKVEAISEQSSWDSISFGDMRRFIHGCGLSFCSPNAMRRVDAYLRSNPKFDYLREDPQWEDYYKPLMIHWLNHVDPEAKSWPPLKNLLKRLEPLKGKT